MRLEDAVPAIGLISRVEIRQAVAQTWRRALEDSPYDSLQDAVQSPNSPDRSLLLHVNEVNDLALHFIAFARSRFGLYPDSDVTLAAAILHDVDKVQIYERRPNGEVTYREGFSSADHGPRGAEIALACGVPDDVARLVRDHSPFNPIGHLPGTIEGTILHYADLTAADFAAVQAGRPPIHARTSIVKLEVPL